MTKTQERLEDLFAKVRALPQERQQLAVEALSEIAEQETYVLSDDERAVLEPALEDAERIENLSDADREALFSKPWA